MRRRLRLRTGFAILSIALLAGCSASSSAALANAWLHEPGDPLASGMRYGPHERQRLDVYAPPEGIGGPSGDRYPVVVFFYGGSWQGGSREDYRFVGRTLAGEGMVVIVPDYRVYPEVSFPEFVRDGGRAVRWAEEHAARYGGDPGNVFVMGHSAGAHIAALLTYDERYLRDAGARRVRGLVGLAGPYDFLPIRDRVLQELFGPEERWPESQPVGFVDGSEPPALLVTGGLDWTVSPGNTRRLAERIRAEGGRVEVIVYGWLGHRTLVGALAPPFRWWAPLVRETAAFVRAATTLETAEATP